MTTEALPNAFRLALLAVVMMSVFLSAYAFFQRRVRSAFEFALFMAAIAFYAAGYTMSTTAKDLPGMLAAIRFEYLGLAFIPALWLLFAYRYVYPQKPKLVFYAVAFAIPTLALLLVWTNRYHGLYYMNTRIRSDGPFPVFGFDKGPAYWLQFCYLQLAIFGGNVILLRHALRSRTRLRRQALIVVAGSLIPWGANIAYIMGKIPFGIDLGPFSVSFAGFFFGIGLFRFGFLEMVPVARNLAVDSSSDGFLIVDYRGLILDANAAARKLLGVANLQEGEELPFGIPGSDELRALIALGDGKQEFPASGPDGAIRRLSAQAFAVTDRRGKTMGSALVIRDVTELAALMEKLRLLADTDELTGVFARRRFFESGARELELSRREMRPFAVLMLDLDHFKQVNDLYGHSIGDAVLSAAALCMSGSLRSVDIIGRYGGEEFAIVLPGAHEEDAFAAAERLRCNVEAMESRREGGNLRITASFGVCSSVPAPEDTFEEYLRRADEAMYAAKAAGRNRVSIWKPPASS